MTRLPVERLHSKADSLFAKFEQSGEAGYIDQAIILDYEALELCPPGHPKRFVSLTRLAVHLSDRYDRLGSILDLDTAIMLNREALDLRPTGHPDYTKSLNTLATHLFTRYCQLGDMVNLDEAIVINRVALDLYPLGHPERSTSLNNIAICISIRYEELGAISDIHEVIVLCRELLSLRPPEHPLRSSSLSNLAIHLFTRYNQLEAIELRSPGHPDRTQTLNNLARLLLTQFTRLDQLDDKEELFSLYAQLVDVPQMVTLADLYATQAWIFQAELFNHPTTLLAYETALRLLIQDLATFPFLLGHLKTLAVDAFSACLRRRAPVRAVELLEQGRGVFWNQLIRLCSPLDEVAASGKAGKLLAIEFRRLTSLIRITLDSPITDQLERECRLNLELQKVVTSIRALPGLSRFLLPPLFSDLQRAASEGPVIIVNASMYSCDALVISDDQDPVHIPLSITQDGVRCLSSTLCTLTVRAKRLNVTRHLGVALRQLWDDVVSPIVDFLQTRYPSQSRIWWCPTGDFSLLPLHAAGPYRKGQQNLADLYISSYTPTLTALIRARRPSDTETERKCIVAIGQAKAFGQREFPFVDTELASLGQHIEGLATFTRIEGSESCLPRVAKELRKNQWVHLACHALPDQQRPYESWFALHDGPFTMEHIIQCDLKNPEFAFLSCCHPTVGDEEEFPDEAIHLASMMQFAGFQSVIGTMWAVDDGTTEKITSTFYEHLVDASGRLDHTRAAFALNKTMKTADIPLDQRIVYIHVGA